MSDHIKTRTAAETWVVRATGAVIAESARTVELSEGAYPSVNYFPREDVAMAFLEPSARRTQCPHKGEATYFHIVGKSGTLTDAAWSYEAPRPGMEAIAGHLAFDAEQVTVEAL